MGERYDTELNQIAKRVADVLNDFAGRMPITPDEVDLTMVSDLYWALGLEMSITLRTRSLPSSEDAG